MYIQMWLQQGHITITRGDTEVMGRQTSIIVWKWQVIILFFSCNKNGASENLQYSVLEEAEIGTLVGNITDDLGLPKAIMSERRIQLRSSGGGRFFFCGPTKWCVFCK